MSLSKSSSSHNNSKPCLSSCFVGIDVAKLKLDLCLLGTDHPKHKQFHNTKSGHAQIVAFLSEFNVTCIALEATGGYERDVAASLQLQGLSVAIVNPRIARRFAEGIGLLAKTDRIDAFMLAEFARLAQPRTKSLKTNKNLVLSDLNARRRQLSQNITAEQNRLQRADVPLIKRRIKAHLTYLAKELQLLMAAISEEITKSEESSQRNKLLQSMPGIGIKVAAALIGDLPELGHLNRGKIASLVGVAPMARESGSWKGQRFIRGGRSWLRSQLYMAAVVAARFNPVMKAFYQKKVEAGQPKKKALVAVMRKMLITLNSMCKTGELWREKSICLVTEVAKN